LSDLAVLGLSGRLHADNIAAIIMWTDEDRRHALFETAIGRLRQGLAVVTSAMRDMGATDDQIRQFDVAATGAFADRISDILLGNCKPNPLEK
jgi:hypothetical protein